MADVEEIRARFLTEFCPPLDTATVLAILQDYDLVDKQQLDAAQITLDYIKRSAAEEEASGFDPSGSSGADALLESGEGSGRVDNESASGRSHHGGNTNSDTSLSQGLSSLDLEFFESDVDTGRIEGTEMGYIADWDGLDEEGKESILTAIFPELRLFDIKWSLKKCKGNPNLAVDELMTQSFLEASGNRYRGIEAFSEGDLPARPRKSKGQRKRAARTEKLMNITASESPAQAASKWETVAKDVEFISLRTGIPAQQVSSLYHQHEATVKSTILAILKAHSDMKLDSEEPMIRSHASELGQKFPTITPSDIATLIQITYPSKVHAYELAQALISHPTNSGKAKVQVEFRRAPVNLDSVDSESESVKSKPKSHNAVYSNGTRIAIDTARAAAIATNYRDARDTAFTQASAAYRKGKSDPLMGGAAAYYSQVGRDLDVRVKGAERDAADALAARQSSKTGVDLHGVSVKDAVRISRERVTAWWHELSDERVRGGRSLGEGYMIVTGVGKHSDGGKGKLGPAVGKMLMREGWKVEVGSGVLRVTGIARKR